MQLSLIQPLFDFACCAWYPNLSMSLKNKLQTAENACIRFCLGQERRSHIRVNQFQKINRLPVKKKVDKWIAVTAYNFKNKLSPVYVSYIYTLNSSPVVKTRSSVDSFVEPIYMKEISRKSISYLGCKIWNGLDQNTKNFVKHIYKTVIAIIVSIIYLFICLFIYSHYVYTYIYNIYIYIIIIG